MRMDQLDSADEDDFDNITTGIEVSPFTKMLVDFSNPDEWPDELPGRPV